jgi:hypothetical protein
MRPLSVRLIAAVAMVMAAMASVAGQPQLIDRTLAIVGGAAITLSDVRTAMALGLVNKTQDVDIATEALVQRALILREVERYAPPDPEPALVAQRLAALAARMDPDAWRRTLAAGGFTDSRLRAWVRDDLRISAYLDQRFAADGPERRQSLIADWVSDLRRRTSVVELWRR